MDTNTLESIADPAAANELRDLCEKTEPDALWEVLEAKGIETTPGVLYQVLSKHKEEAPHDTGHGLTPEDLSTLGSLAAKVGGVEQLIRILEACR